MHVVVDRRFWRMLTVAWQRSPLQSGSHVLGARLNPPGQAALYLAPDHETAIAEFYQGLVRPGTLAGYDVRSPAIVDLTTDRGIREARADRAAIEGEWRLIRDDGRRPPGWAVAERLLGAGAHGALYRSTLTGAPNLVLWRWHRTADGGDGAAVTLIDPTGELAR